MLSKTILMISLAVLSINAISTALIRGRHKSRELVGLEVVQPENVFLRFKTLFKLKRNAMNNLRFSNVIEKPTSKILCESFLFSMLKIKIFIFFKKESCLVK